MARIGVYVCQCGGNVSDVVDVDKVAQFASAQPNVVVARSISHMCSESGQKATIDDVEEHRLDPVVVAACSPHFHGETFRKTVSKVSLNPYMVRQGSGRISRSIPCGIPLLPTCLKRGSI
jgi:heterodisulfide reductase subunit A